MKELVDNLKQQIKIAKATLTYITGITNGTAMNASARSAIADLDKLEQAGRQIQEEKIPDTADLDITLTYGWGDDLSNCIDSALVISKKLNKTVSFEFNGCKFDVYHWDKKEKILKQYDEYRAAPKEKAEPVEALEPPKEEKKKKRTYKKKTDTPKKK